MSGNSADEQSEDGELRQSPQIVKNTKDEMDFSLSEDDAEVVDDSLDIKPPQAKAALPSSKSKRREGHRRSSDKHRDERYSHRDKHHRDQKRSLGKDPRSSAEHYQREKDRFYREQQQTHQSNPEFPSNERRERRMERNRHPERKHDDKKSREVRDSRHVTREAQVRDMEKQYENQKFKDDRHRDKADKALHDLRERLLSKRTTKDDHSDHKSRSDGHRHRRSKPEEIALEGEAGMYVKEMITLTTTGDDKKSRRKAKEEEREKLTDEERQEQELRREKLLEAEREMARLKEQSKIDRERRHQEKTTKRKQEMDEALSKRMKMEDMVVMVSDNSDYEDLDTRNNSENSPGDNSENEDKSDTDKESADDGQSSEDEHSARSRSDRSSESRKHSSRSRSKSKSRSRSRSKSFEERDRSRTRSEERDFETDKQKAEAKEKIQDKDKPVEDDESRKPKLDEDLPPYFPAIQGCRSVEEFQCLNRIEEGTYGVVYRARDKRTEEIVALKRLKMEKEKEGFPITSLREINTLLKGQHKNIVTVREIVVGSNMDKIFIVMDYVEHDLKSLMETMRHKKQSFTSGEVKCILRQLLLAVGHLHDNWILHRDLKTSNLLLSHKGILKVGDFGLAREYGSPLKAYTPIVVTLWYRAPELLLCTKEYSTPIDMWSVGCIFAELVLMNALFPGKSEVDQLNRIFKDLGTPSEKIWPGFNKLPAVQKMKFTEYPVSNLRNKFHALTENGVDLLLKFLTFDPVQRITAEAALEHAYFVEHPLPIDPAMFPTWPAKSELGQKRAMNTSPKPPSGGGEYKKLRGDDDGYGFRIGAGLENKRTMGFSLKF